MSDYTFLINSSDAYDDCWAPFFTLLRAYWPGIRAPILVNTESKTVQVDGMRVRWAATESSVDRRSLEWGARLLDTLRLVETPLVLMTLDDFFIKAPVNESYLDDVVTAMVEERVGHVQLCGPNRPYVGFGHPFLVEKGRRSPYRISLQVGLWKPRCLARYLRRHENPWQTENDGTRRSWRSGERFLAIDPDYSARHGVPIPYDDTGGIARGRWYREKVEPLFSQHGIEVDFSRRGWYRPGVDSLHRPPFLRRVIDYVRSSV
jgi:hypothetical protein